MYYSHESLKGSLKFPGFNRFSGKCNQIALFSHSSFSAINIGAKFPLLPFLLACYWINVKHGICLFSLLHYVNLQLNYLGKWWWWSVSRWSRSSCRALVARSSRLVSHFTSRLNLSGCWKWTVASHHWTSGIWK